MIGRTAWGHRGHLKKAGLCRSELFKWEGITERRGRPFLLGGYTYKSTKNITL
jgi:hypothetical protein